MGADARAETIRYHEALYRHDDGGSDWLRHPSQFVLDAAGRLPDRPVTVWDLGCGIGRHAVPVAALLRAGSRVIGVDLLPVAVEGLREAARAAGVADRVETRTTDLGELELDVPADLMIGVSALEHVGGEGRLEALLRRCRAATKPGGLHCWIFFTDRSEVCRDGHRRPARLERSQTPGGTERLLGVGYARWEVLQHDTEPYGVEETRGHESYRLVGTADRFLARRPG